MFNARSLMLIQLQNLARPSVQEFFKFKICYVTDIEAEKCLLSFDDKAQDTLAEKERERERERDSNKVKFYI